MIYTALFLVTLCFMSINLLFFDNFNVKKRRKLSLKQDLFTGENIQTIDGIKGGSDTFVPVTSCPLGTYRPAGNTNLVRVYGQREDGCMDCPKGTYGDQLGLKTSTCGGYCPKGTYSDIVGLTSVSQCKQCTPGTYGNTLGLSTNQCTATCPLGYYNDIYGAISVKQCIICPKGYRGWQCTWAIQPHDQNKDTDHQHLEYFGLSPGFKDPYPKKHNRLRGTENIKQ